MRVRLLLLASLLPLAGCFGALANLDGYHISGGGDFCWNLMAFTPHVADPVHMVPPQAVGLRVIDQTNTVTAYAVYDPLPAANEMSNPPLSGPLDPTKTYRVQIFADRNGNRTIDPYPTDHVWDLDYASMSTSGCFTFTHGPPFEMTGIVSGRADDPNRTAAMITLHHMAVLDGKAVVMILHDMAAMTQVAYYRYVIHPLGAAPLPLDDLIVPDTEYVLTAYVDLNDDGVQNTATEPTVMDMESAPDATAPLQFTLDLMM